MAIPELQMCTVDDIIGGEPCLRLAQVEWRPVVYEHPVFLCNFHAEPFEPIPVQKDGTDGG
jgi:hypothetical protein